MNELSATESPSSTPSLHYDADPLAQPPSPLDKSTCEADLEPTRPTRRAARIIYFNAENRVLLFRFTPEGWPPFWCAPGGGCDPNETFVETAVRELFEETGVIGNPRALDEIKSYDFITLAGQPVRALEHYFYLRARSDYVDTKHHTDLERELMVEHHWFSADELQTWKEPIWPKDIPALLERALVAKNIE